jgi:hypothetical protein
MNRSPRPAQGMRVAALVLLALFALAPFFGTAGATSVDEDLRALIERLQEFKSQVRGGELTPIGVDRQAQRMIALKRDFVLASKDKTGVDLDAYLDLARIDKELGRTAAGAGHPRRARNQVAEAIADTRVVIDDLLIHPDAAAYTTAVACLEDLEASERDLAADMRAGAAGNPTVTPRGIRRRAAALEATKLDCIAAWPLVFGKSFQVTYVLLKAIDEELESISDRADDPRLHVVQSLDEVIERARELRRQIEEWTTGTPSASATRMPTPTPSASKPATPIISPSITPSVSASTSASQTPTPEESPTGINPKPPNVSAITATFEPANHRTTYSVTASDPDGDALTFTWTKSDERSCGTFAGSGPNATWNHQEPPCPVENPHPGTINVFVSDGTYTCSATYEGGSASGTGTPASCDLAPRPRP